MVEGGRGALLGRWACCGSWWLPRLCAWASSACSRVLAHEPALLVARLCLGALLCPGAALTQHKPS